MGDLSFSQLNRKFLTRSDVYALEEDEWVRFLGVDIQPYSGCVGCFQIHFGSIEDVRHEIVEIDYATEAHECHRSGRGMIVVALVVVWVPVYRHRIFAGVTCAGNSTGICFITCIYLVHNFNR